MEQVPVKVTITSSPRKRAKTWEISDSEDEEPDCSLKGDIKGEKICPQVADHADDCAFPKARPEELLRDQQGELDIDAKGHGWNGFDVIAKTVEPSEHQKEQSNVHHPPTTSDLLLLLPQSTTPSPGKRSSKKKCPKEVEADRTQAEKRKSEKEVNNQHKERMKTLEKQEHGLTSPDVKATSVELSELEKAQRDVNDSPTTSCLSLPPRSTSPSPVKRSRKKKSPEELEAVRAQAEERKKEKTLKCQNKNRVKTLEKQEHVWTDPDEKAGSVEGSEHQKEQRNVHQTPTTSGLLVSLPKSTSPSPVKRSRKKKSHEELEADRAQAEERKQEKELKRLEKEKIKNLEKEEREKRKESAQALKLLRPDQCGKYMIVQVDAGLLQDAGSEDVLEALRLAGYKHSIEPLSTPWSITWRREMPVGWTCVEGLELCKGEENEMLIMVEPRDFLKSVSCYIQVPENSRSSETAASMFGMDRKFPGKKITLAVLGLRDYRRYQRLSHRMERHSLEPRHFCDEQLENHVTRHHIDEALVFLQLYHGTEVLFLDTWRELGQHVCAVTKSIAQRPFRLHWEAQSYSFCTSAGTWRGWGPKGLLTGLPLAWRRQIQQLNRVSPAMAAAITEAFPSPQLLMQAYVSCNSDKERLSLLSNLRVQRAANTTEDMDDPDQDITRPDNQDQARERRIGPDLSRRIWLFMTSTNPELVLDLNS